MFSSNELFLIEQLRSADRCAWPYDMTDREIDIAVAAIKRERGDKLQQLKRQIRTEFAERHGLTFAMDGGFMWDRTKRPLAPSEKCWPDNANWIFGLVWADYEQTRLDELARAEDAQINGIRGGYAS